MPHPWVDLSGDSVSSLPNVFLADDYHAYQRQTASFAHQGVDSVQASLVSGLFGDTNHDLSASTSHRIRKGHSRQFVVDTR